MKLCIVMMLALLASTSMAAICCKAITAKCRSCSLTMSLDDYCYACVYQGLNDAGCYDCPRTVTKTTPTSITDCQLQAQHAMSIPGRFTPQCNEDGSYASMQCHASTGYCWCVDNNGQEVDGTRQAPGSVPNCAKASLSPCQLQASQASYGYGGFRPRCEDDGSYSSMQCHGSTGYCWCVTPDGAEINGTRVAPGTMANCTKSSAPLSPCQIAVEASANDKVGQYIPQCEADGTYSALQCHGSTGFCWCADRDGNEIEGSRKEPGDMPACAVYTSGLCALQLAQAGRGYGAFRPQCEDDGTFSSMQCHGSTGYCWCVDTQTGIEINGTRQGPGNMPNCANKLMLTKCQSEVSAAAPVFGAFVPQCEKDGSYSSLQCHGSTGYCWCATPDGTEIPGSRKGPGNAVNCNSVAQSLTPCQMQAIQASHGYGSYRPQCEADGSYSKLQCHGSTGYCWCVESNGKAIDSTRRGPGNVPDCNALSDAQMSACQMQVAQSSRLVGSFTPQCEAGGSYSSLQCWASTGYCWCVDSNGQEILNTRKGPGRVPDCRAATLTPCLLQQTQASHGYGSFSPQCNSDGSYSRVQCHASTGYCWCVEVNGQEIDNSRVGPGHVPNCTTLNSPMLALGRSNQVLHAVADLSECENLAADAAGRIGAYVPQCEKDGSYSPLQCWGSTGFCWCVNGTGIEFDGSRRRGVPDCDKFLLSPCLLQRKQASPGFGSFRPKCNDDGTYSALQCHGSTGYCWCVSPDGKEIDGTRTGPGGVPQCASAVSQFLTPRRFVSMP